MLDDLRRRGAEMRVFAADVTWPPDMEHVLREIAAGMPALRGIFHGAGVLDDGALINQSWERFERVLGPKLDGAWTLHVLTRDLPLDLFVLYSSTASLLGSPGQANHAAANGFLDALAHVRRQRGLPATSINWSAWAQVGAAARPDVERRLAAQGIDMIPPAKGIAALEAILAAGLCQAGVLPMHDAGHDAGHDPRHDPGHDADRDAGRDAGAPRAGLLRGAGPALRPAARASSTAAALRRRLDEAVPGERLVLLVEELQRLVAQTLRLGAADGIDPRVGFFELGMDSLMALEIRIRIQQWLDSGRSLPVTALFDHPNIERLAAFLLHSGWPEDGRARGAAR